MAGMLKMMFAEVYSTIAEKQNDGEQPSCHKNPNILRLGHSSWSCTCRGTESDHQLLEGPQA